MPLGSQSSSRFCRRALGRQPNAPRAGDATVPRLCFHAPMRSLFAPSLSLAVVACLAVGASVEACGGTADGGGTFPPDSGGGGVVFEGGGGEAGGPDAATIYDEPLSVFGTYAVRTVFLGETNRSGAATKDAWKDYGLNLDGIVSSKTANGECKLQAGADSSKREDGKQGIDNSFGRTVLGFILGLVPTPSKTANDEIAKGARTMMLNLLPPAATPARFGLLAAASTATPPAFTGTDVRAVSAGSVGAGGPADALSMSTTPAMKGSVVYSGIAGGTFYLELPLQGATWRIPVRHARVTMDISPDGVRGNNGTLSGIVPTEELVTEMGRIAGRISTQLCGGSTLDTIKQTIRQASDILIDGPQDPTKSCDGISIGIGFEAVKVTAPGVQADPPPPDPCVGP